MIMGTRVHGAAESGTPGLTNPVRYPQTAPPEVRTKRAFVLLAMTLVLPGSAQVVAGDRRLGRRALRTTFACWALILLGLVVALTNRTLAVGIVTHRWWSLALIVALLGIALGWALLFVNTLRLIRMPLLDRGVRPLVAGALALLMVLTSGSLAYGAYVLGVGRSTVGSIFQSGPAFDPVDGRYNFLLMGGDAGEDRTGRRPDSISVISVDAETGSTVTFSIPRNFQNAQFSADSPLWDVYPDGYNCGDPCIINSLYTDVTQNYTDLYPGAADPGAEAMMDAASGVLGIEVQSYLLVDMNGFEQLVDAMGGIRIDAGGWVPITAGEIPGSDPIRHYPPDGWIKPGVQTLDGYHALWYARSREFVTDYDRIARQQCVQQAMIAQLDPATVLTRFQSIAAAGTQIVETDIPQDQLASFVDLGLKAKGQETRRLTIGPPDFGTPAENFVTYPDFDLIHDRVQEMIAGSGATPAAAAALPLERAGVVSGLPAQTTDDGITEEYLQELATIGDDATLGDLLADNGQCSPA
ncbi:LCP family glycopolymer transferase [Arthrobacter agilis]|uniref:LCP family glycopolymer transferase n=1 Tax=Arthrobacter agilis TaxID=37921 RepID=UPI002783506A|nr:LCP family protein [Arthrobacter agilis]MDQ0733992.1 LCP family protein required for cell wall assembly [Arthrobacter agilis]